MSVLNPSRIGVAVPVVLVAIVAWEAAAVDAVFPIHDFQFSVVNPVIGDGRLNFQQVEGQIDPSFSFSDLDQDAGTADFQVPGVLSGGPLSKPTTMDIAFSMEWTRRLPR